MAAKRFNQYIWLCDVIYSAGRITFPEIANKWLNSSVNDRHEPLARRTFARWRDEIEDTFNLIIDCDRTNNNYYIANADDITNSTTQRWLLNTFAVTNLVAESRKFQDRILLEEMPSDARFLTTIMEAIRDGHVLSVSYQRFDALEGRTFEFQPYCLKVFKQRWYTAGISSDHPDELRVYALDRIHEIKTLDKTYTIPADFDAKAYFKNYYGVWLGQTGAQTVRIEASEREAKYIRSLPLHNSQKEIERTGNSVIFEYYIVVSYDFIQELRTRGPEIKVLQPQFLADEFKQLGKDYVNLYREKPKNR